MSVARLTLAVGSEALLVDRAVLAVSRAARHADPAVLRSDIEANDDDAVLRFREATAPNLFGDGGVVVVHGIDAADEALALAIREVLSEPPDHVFLVLTHPGGVKAKALLDAIKAGGAEVVDCRPVKGASAATAFITREFASHRRKATGPAIATLYESVGHDLGLLSAAVSQLVADVETSPIDVDDVRAYFAGVADVASFTISDAVWDRDYVKAVTSLRQAVLAGDVGPGTTGALANGLRALVRVGGVPPGTSPAAIAKEAGVPDWKVRLIQRQWPRWSAEPRRLAGAVVAIADADAAVKGGVLEGSSLDPEQKLLALEILVARTVGASPTP